MLMIRILILMSLMLSYPASAREWAFNAYLNGQNIGPHSFVVDEKGSDKELLSSARFKVKVLFVTAYDYMHVAHEKWQGDCLTSIESKTVENDVTTEVNGRLQNGSFMLEGPKGNLSLPSCPMTFAYWNPQMLKQSKLLNPQTGEWLDVKITALGNENILVRDKPVEAEHYRIEATKMKIDLWYSHEKDWLALQSRTPEGYTIIYKLR